MRAITPLLAGLALFAATAGAAPKASPLPALPPGCSYRSVALDGTWNQAHGWYSYARVLVWVDDPPEGDEATADLLRAVAEPWQGLDQSPTFGRVEVALIASAWRDRVDRASFARLGARGSLEPGDGGVPWFARQLWMLVPDAARAKWDETYRDSPADASRAHLAAGVGTGEWLATRPQFADGNRSGPVAAVEVR